MNQVSEYYIVPKNVYENFKEEKNHIPERFCDLPISSRKKVFALDDWLKQNNISLGDSVIAYAVRGRFRPADWSENIHNLFEVPSKLLSVRVYNEVKRLRNKKRKEET